MKAFKPPPAVDLFEQFICAARPELRALVTPKGQLELLWSLAKVARDLAANDVWEDAFRALADELGLATHRHIRADGIEHVLHWAWHGRNPFR